MESFKKILLKKAENDPVLSTLLHFMSEERLTELTLESLEKMARPHASMGRGANAAVTAFAHQMRNKDVEMIRDALSHHISHYRSALKHGKREVADKHLEKIIPLLHLVGRASAHSGGQISLDYVPLEAWESNYTTIDRRPETGKLIEGTKGLGRRPKKSTGQSKYGISRSVPDYRYLEMPPHPGHPDTKKMPHKGGYPFEEIQVGNPAKIDAREAYLHIYDVEPKDEFTPHPFDFHPIHEFADLKQDHLTPERMKKFAEAMQKWHESEHNKKWIQSLKESYAKDPQGFLSRGKNKPSHFFEGLTLLDQPDHVKSALEALPEELKAKYMKKPEAKSSSAATPSESKAQTPKIETPKVETPSSSTTETPKVEKPKTGLSPEHLANLPKELASKFGNRG